jgi:uncharacterized protein (TIGR02145 family)
MMGNVLIGIVISVCFFVFCDSKGKGGTGPEGGGGGVEEDEYAAILCRKDTVWVGGKYFFPICDFSKYPFDDSITVFSDYFDDTLVYRTVIIGKQRWLAENIRHNVKVGKSWCYENSEDSCKKYGRLYTEDAASRGCRFNDTKGGTWGLAGSGSFWGSRFSDYDSIGLIFQVGGWEGGQVAGGNLKSTSGWWRYDTSDVGNVSINDNNGTDDYGFSMLPGGFVHEVADGTVFSGAGRYGYLYVSGYGYITFNENFPDSVLYSRQSFDPGLGDGLVGISARCVQIGQNKLGNNYLW